MAGKQEIQNVIDSTDIVALVSEYVQLEKQGKNYKGLCPFHHEDTPSFVVNQEKKIAHCFGCGGGGDPIHFLMQIENLDFGSALRKLAKRNGIELSGYQENTTSNPLTKYYQIMHTALEFYKKCMETTDNGVEAKKYLYKRGLDDETIKMFGIGLSPHSQDALYRVLKESNYLELDMVDIGLVDGEGGYHDKFTRRIMFPIFDEFGNGIGFSGRIFNNSDKSQPKYVNSPESVLFKKRDILFNLHQAKGEILRKKRVILHEGQMDVIASYRSGLKEAVCTMGTALSMNQALLLKKYTNHAVICYDGDKAGIQASLKAIRIFKSAGFIIHLVLLPNGMDPDEFVMKNGAEAYASYFENHLMDSNAYIFEQAVQGKNLEDETVLSSVKEEVFSMLSGAGSKTAEENYLKKLSDILHCSYQALYGDYQAYCNRNVPSDYVDFYEPDRFEKKNFYPKEIQTKCWNPKYELRLLMYAKSSREKALYIDRILNDKNRIEALSEKMQSLWISLVNGYYAEYAEYDEKTFVRLLDEEAQSYYTEIVKTLNADKIPYTDEDLYDCLEKLKLVKLDKTNERLTEEIAKTDSFDNQMGLIADKFKNKKQIDQLKKMRRK